MTKLIGGLLVLALLIEAPTPTSLKFDYELIDDKFQTVQLLKKEENEQKEPEYLINGLVTVSLNRIDENKRTILDLTRQKTNLLAKIDARMDLLSFAKVSLSDEQIENYKLFNSICTDSETNIQENYVSIFDQVELTDVKNELLKLDPNKNYIYKKLKQFILYQQDIISYLTNIISMSNQLLVTI